MKKFVCLFAILMVAGMTGCPKNATVMVADSEGGGEVKVSDWQTVEVYGDLIVSLKAKPEDVRVDVYGSSGKTFESADIGWVALGAGAIIAGSQLIAGNGGTAEFYQGTVPLANGEEVRIEVFVKNTQRCVFYAKNIANGNGTGGTYTLATSVQGQGTISPVSGVYDAGEVVQVAATPASGWTFDHWVVNGEMGTNNPQAEINMDGDVQLVAVFTASGGNNNGGVITNGAIKIALTWNGSSLTMSATNAPGTVIGLELYHTAGGAPWVERQTFATSSGAATGTLTQFRYSSSHILRFAVVGATSGGYIPHDSVTATLGGVAIPLVNDGNGNIAFQVTVP